MNDTYTDVKLKLGSTNLSCLAISFVKFAVGLPAPAICGTPLALKLNPTVMPRAVASPLWVTTLFITGNLIDLEIL